MPKIRDLKVRQVRVFPADEIPYAILLNSKTRSQLAAKYDFSIPGELERAWHLHGQGLHFQNGTYQIDDSRILIEQLTIEERRVLITVNGDTGNATAFFEELRRFFAKIDQRPGSREYRPILHSEETQCIAVLDFEFPQLLKKGPLDRFESAIEASTHSFGATLDIFPRSIKFAIRYLKPPESLSKQYVTLSDKELTIETRGRTAIEDRVFFTTSPLNTSDHIDLLEQLENMVKQSSK